MGRIASNVEQLQSEGKAVMEEQRQHLESMRGMFEGSTDVKSGGGGLYTRINELERLLLDTRLERDRLKRQLADMEDQLARYR